MSTTYFECYYLHVDSTEETTIVRRRLYRRHFSCRPLIIVHRHRPSPMIWFAIVRRSLSTMLAAAAAAAAAAAGLLVRLLIC